LRARRHGDFWSQAKTMKIIDRILAWILLVLGCVHCFVTFLVHKTFTVEAIWFLSGGLVLIFGALLNLVRIARPSDGLLARASALANLLLFALFGIATPWLLHRHLQQNPQVIAVAIAVAGELGFSLRQCFR
jgi:intracellular septation protein A